MADVHVPLPVERLEPIDELARGIACAADVHEVFRALFAFATRTTPATGIFVALYSPGTELRRCVYAAEAFPRADGTRVLEEDEELGIHPEIPLDAGPRSRAILTGDVVDTPDFGEA